MLGPELLDWLPTVAGALHFVQLPAMVVAQRVLAWGPELERLSAINRRIIQVIGGGITICVLGLGTLVMALHGQLLHSAPGIGLCAFLSVFWSYRGAVQLFLYGRIWPPGQRWAHAGCCLLFFVLVSTYTLSALLA